MSLSFLMTVSPTAPVPALILLLARRGHRSLVARETEKSSQSKTEPAQAQLTQHTADNTQWTAAKSSSLIPYS